MLSSRIRFSETRVGPTSQNLLALFERDEESLRGTGARRGSALQVLAQLRKTPYTSPARMAESTGLSFDTVVSLEVLKGAAIVREMQRGVGVSFFIRSTSG